MRKVLKSLSLFIASALFASPSLAQDMTALVGGRVIDGTGNAPVDDAIVLVEGDKILAVGPQSEIAVPDGARVIDTNGMTVMPGLVDVHVHFDILGHADYPHWFGTYEPVIRSKIMPAAAAAMLRAGVTSVRDLGADVKSIFSLREAVNSGELPGPRTFIAGPFLRKTAKAFVSQDYQDTWVVEDAEDGRRKVQELARMGVDVIKTQDEALSLEELRAIYDEAHRQGLRVASHIYTEEGIRRALQAGLGEYDTIEHVGVNERLEYAPDIVRMIVDQKVAMAPTITALEGVQRIIDNPELTDNPRWSRDVADAAIYADIRRSYREANLAEHPIVQRANADREGRFAKLRHLYESGAIFAISSDSGTRGNPHHDAMWQEMILTHRVTGMPSMEVIQAATQTNARILQIDDRLGTLEPGKLADIIVIDGDPLADLSDMRHVHAVIKGGEIVWQPQP